MASFSGTGGVFVGSSGYEENEAALDAGECVALQLGATKRKISPPPHNHLILFNNDKTSILKLVLNGGIANQEIVGGAETFFVQSNSFIEIEPSDHLQFDWIIVENTHATHNIAIGDIKFAIKNF